jgi:hypothetical protein
MKYKIILLMISFFGIIGCGDVPIFTEMETNRLKVVIKGTFETEGTSNFTSMPAVNGVLMQDDSVDDVPAGSNDALPTTFMIDIAELRLEGKKFANYRKTIEASLAGDGSSEPFFNGEGVVLENDDPGEGHYDTVQVYVRKMIFDNAMIYQSAGSSLSYEKPAEVIFHENDRFGFDFNQLQVNSYWDSLRIESGDILRCFPIQVPIIGGLDYDKDNDETVLEIRFVIKNFVKKYEYDYYDSGVFKVAHYYAPSDWLRDVRAGENDIGRNLHAVARAYVPEKTGVISGSGAGNNLYVIAIPETENINDYTISSSGSTLRTNNKCDLPQPPSYPGAYIEAVLDYYLKYEKYKNDYNLKLRSKTLVATDCWGFDSSAGTPNYTDSWNTYESEVENFKIAPYIVLADGSGNYSFNDVAPGRYNVYRATIMPTYGNLFIDGQFVQIGTTVTVTAP